MVNSNLESENISLNKKLKENETIIDNLKDENKTLSSKIKYFKDMFYNLVQFLMDKIFRIKDNKYKEFTKELYEHGALDDKNYEDIIGMSKSANIKENDTIEKDDFEHNAFYHLLHFFRNRKL